MESPDTRDRDEPARLAAITRILGRAYVLGGGGLSSVSSALLPVRSPTVLVADETEKTIIAFLERGRPQSRAALSSALSIPRATLQRRLKHLQVLGLVVATGRTRNAVYEIRRETMHGSN